MRTPQQIRDYSKEWFRKNKKRELLKRSNYQKENRTIINLWNRNYRKTPEGFFAHIKKIARRRKIEFLLEKDWFVDWLNKQESVCDYCRREFSYNREIGTSPSLDRKDSSKGYTKDNIILCCELCNRAKNKYFTAFEFVEIGKIINKIFKKRNAYN